MALLRAKLYEFRADDRKYPEKLPNPMQQFDPVSYSAITLFGNIT